MRVVIYGVGAVGGVVGAALVAAGHDVIGIARGRRLAALKAGPLTLRTPSGVEKVRVPCVASPTEIAFRNNDLILLTMKSQDTVAALHALRAAGVRNQAIFCLQNGIANEATSLRYFPNVHGVTVMMPASYVQDDEVLGYGAPMLGLFDLGRFPNGTDAADDTLTDLFDSARMRGFPHADVMASKRGKLLLNLGNVLEAALGAGADRGAYTDFVRAEAEAVFQAAGLSWDNVGMSDPRRKDLMQFGEIEGVGRFGGSTTQSLLRGTGHVETDYLNGEIVLLGRMYGVPTPVNAFLASLGAALAAERVPPGEFGLADLEKARSIWNEGGDIRLPT